MLKGAEKVTLRKDTLKPATRKTARAAANAAALADGGAGDAAVRGVPRKRRSELAKESGSGLCGLCRQAYSIWRGSSLDSAEMSAVHGVGEAKLRQYGEVFLEAIREHAVLGSRVPGSPAGQSTS